MVPLPTPLEAFSNIGFCAVNPNVSEFWYIIPVPVQLTKFRNSSFHCFLWGSLKKAAWTILSTGLGSLRLWEIQKGDQKTLRVHLSAHFRNAKEYCFGFCAHTQHRKFIVLHRGIEAIANKKLDSPNGPRAAPPGCPTPPVCKPCVWGRWQGRVEKHRDESGTIPLAHLRPTTTVQCGHSSTPRRLDQSLFWDPGGADPCTHPLGGGGTHGKKTP